jgi:hypothetical protein
VLAKQPNNADYILNQLKNFQAKKCDPATAKKAKQIMGNVTVEVVNNASKAVYSLAVWVCI